jgi:predicted negative regulator of RcsB-dependent stress response
MSFDIFLSPAFFYGLLAALLILGMISIFSWQDHDKKLSRSKKETSKNYETHLENLEAIWLKKEKSYNEKINLMEDLIREKSDGLKNSLGAADNLSKKTDELKKELALSNQMYEGLKGQYDELEEKFSQLFQQFLEEQKKQKSTVKQFVNDLKLSEDFTTPSKLPTPPFNKPEEDGKSLIE